MVNHTRANTSLKKKIPAEDVLEVKFNKSQLSFHTMHMYIYIYIYIYMTHFLRNKYNFLYLSPRNVWIIANKNAL